MKEEFFVCHRCCCLVTDAVSVLFNGLNSCLDDGGFGDLADWGKGIGSWGWGNGNGGGNGDSGVGEGCSGVGEGCSGVTKRSSSIAEWETGISGCDDA